MVHSLRLFLPLLSLLAGLCPAPAASKGPGTEARQLLVYEDAPLIPPKPIAERDTAELVKEGERLLCDRKYERALEGRIATSLDPSLPRRVWGSPEPVTPGGQGGA